MKKGDRCGYEGEGHFQPVMGHDLCPSCYAAWQFLEGDVFNRFLEAPIRIERERMIIEKC